MCGFIEALIELEKEDLKLKNMADNCLFNKEKIEERLRQLEELEEAFNAGKQGYASFKVYCEKKSEQAFKEFSKFKQEQQSKRDWEILTMIDGNDLIHPHDANDIPCKSACKIHSVKRLVDDCVFVVDEVTNEGRITGFEIFGDDLEAFFEGKTRYCPLSRLKKIEKPKPLWVVFTKDGFGFPTWEVGEWSGNLGDNWDDSVKKFETEFDANEWLVWNGKLVSLKEIKDKSHHVTGRTWAFNFDELKQLASDKLNKK